MSEGSQGSGGEKREEQHWQREEVKKIVQELEPGLQELVKI